MLNSMKPIKLVCIYDAAIDQDAMGSDTLDKYIRSRDFGLISPYFKPGQKPTVYHMKRISRSTMLNRVMCVDSDSERAMRSFQYAITQVDNVRADDGTVHDWKPAGTTQTSAGEQAMVSTSELERFAAADIMEIGQAAWYLSFLRQNSGDYCRVPLTSLDILASQAYQFARASQMTADPSNSSPSAPDSPPSPPTATIEGTDDGNSGRLTDAHAGASE